MSKKNKNTPLYAEKPATYKKILHFIFGKTIPQKMFRFYLFTIFIGAGLLYLPISLQNGDYYIHDGLVTGVEVYSFWDALFVSCSAFSDTGLTTTTIITTYTVFGQIVILLLIQLGGFGFMAIIFLLWNLFRKWNQVDLNQIIILQAERGNAKIGGTYRALRKSIAVILLIEIVFAFIMAFWFCYVPAYQQVGTGGISYDNLAEGENELYYFGNFGLSLWNGLFTSVAAINNAGFDIIGSNSLAPYRNDWNIIFQLLVVIEFVIGGLGFPLIYDLMEKSKYKRKGLSYRLTLFTKIALVGYALVTVCGLMFAYGFEYISASINPTDLNSIINCPNTNQEFGNAEWLNKNFTIFFNTMSTRSAGFATINQDVLSTGSQWTFIILMFIGASPSSTAGGIRTTTLLIVVWTIISKIMGRSRVNMFHRQIPAETVKDAFLVTIVGIGLICLMSIITFYSIPIDVIATKHISLLGAFFETASAFGTTGLSMGVSSSATATGLVSLIITMFIGQLGISSTLLSWTKKNPKGNLVEYPTEDVRIG